MKIRRDLPEVVSTNFVSPYHHVVYLIRSVGKTQCALLRVHVRQRRPLRGSGGTVLLDGDVCEVNVRVVHVLRVGAVLRRAETSETCRYNGRGRLSNSAAENARAELICGGALEDYQSKYLSNQGRV